VIDRKDYGVVPPKIEYRLTRKGKSFVPVIAAIRDWGSRHLSRRPVRAKWRAEWRRNSRRWLFIFDAFSTADKSTQSA
jgi:DNA-binding HxlR family transcriptional regulator